MKIILKKLRGTDYSTSCRDCRFSDVGNNRGIITKAKRHVLLTGHSVEYYIENGRVIKVQ